MRRHLKRYEMGPIKYALLILAGWIYLLFLAGVEGKAFPVASPMNFVGAMPTSYIEPPNRGTSVYDPKGIRTAFWLTSARLRPECSFRSIEFYIGDRVRNNAPIQIAVGPPMARPDGTFTAGPWILGIRFVRFMRLLTTKQIFSDVFHSCKYFGIEAPWLTKTKFLN